MPVILKAYRFSELRGKKAKEKAVDWWREIVSRDGGYPTLNDDLKMVFAERLNELGLPSQNIHYDLSYCQGSGMNFTGKVNIQKYTEAHNLRGWGPMEDLVDIEIVSIDSHYCHWNTMRVEHDDWSNHMDCRHPAAFWVHQHVQPLVEHVEQRIKEVSKELEAKGYEIIESYDSYEFLSEDLKAQDMLFFRDGTPVRH